MSLQYVYNKEDLPKNSEHECPICLLNIDIDEKVDGVPNCVICINGHRMHNICFRQTLKRECPICRTTDIRFCYSKLLGYAYVERKGGKREKLTKIGKHIKREKPKKIDV